MTGGLEWKHLDAGRRALLIDVAVLAKATLPRSLQGVNTRVAGFRNYRIMLAIATMEIDFLVAKPSLTRRKNMSPVEMKSSRRYDHTLLDKFMKKYRSYLHVPYVFHPKDIVVANGVTCLPLYMASLL